MDEEKKQDNQQITDENAQSNVSDDSPIARLFRSMTSLDEPDDYEQFAIVARKSCLGLAYVWNVVAVIIAIGFVVYGIMISSSTNDASAFVSYAIYAFIGWLICRTISAVINLLVSKK